MPTEVQKNFKRQIKEFENQLKNRDNEKFYSYIERDFISSYYETKKRRRRRIISGVSVASLLLFLWNFYAISTWVNHIVYSVTGKTLFSITSVFNRGAEKQKEVANYLRAVDSKEKQVQTLLNDTISVYNKFLLNKQLRHEYAKEINNHIQEVNKSILELKSINPPEVMNEFHEILIAQADLCYKIMQTALYAINSTDVNMINEYSKDINTLIANFNNFLKMRNENLIEAFDEVGMKYEISDDHIRYWWRN